MVDVKWCKLPANSPNSVLAHCSYRFCSSATAFFWWSSRLRRTSSFYIIMISYMKFLPWSQRDGDTFCGHRSHVRTFCCRIHGSCTNTSLEIKARRLLFLNDFSLLSEELKLSFIMFRLNHIDMSWSTLESTPHTLYKATGVSDWLELPLDAEHAPVGLDGDSRLSFLLSLFFSFTL